MPSRNSAGRPTSPSIALTAALALSVILPASSLGVDGYNTDSAAYVAFTAAVPAGGKLVPLVNSGEQVFGTTFEGIPDGIGVVPVDEDHIDLYVTHEQSHVPFPIGVVDRTTGATLTGTADHQDSSVSRVRLQISTGTITDLDVALPPSAGFIRFCSAFMAGPEHGFPDYTFLVNEESDDNLPVPTGAVYGSDPSMTPLREAGFTAWLDTATGAFDVVPGMGRHNHENAVVVPGGWNELAVLSGDDTFNAPASQLYLYTAADAAGFLGDQGKLWAFQVTADDSGPMNEAQIANPFNGANDYGDIATGDTWSGRFISVPDDVAKGTDPTIHPQARLEQWSNANNVFQFIRIEDMDYDPDNARVLYFADTGERRAQPDAEFPEAQRTGRLHRGPSTYNGPYPNGRIFRMVLNAEDPTVVDEFSIYLEASDVGMRNPDNLDVGRKSIMVQEDAANAKIWRQRINKGSWTHVATATQPSAETSGILDLSQSLGDGWWALDVQSHVNQFVDPVTYYWPDGPDPNSDPDPYIKRREDGQLLLMFIPGS